MRLSCKAWYFKSTINEEEVCKKFQDYTIEFLDPLIVKIDATHRVMITSFGAVVFYPYNESLASMVASKITETLTDPSVVKEVEDRLTVEIGAAEDRFLYNEVWLKDSDSTPARMRIIAMLLAQSVALDYLERETDSAMAGFNQYLDDLRNNGRIRLSGRKILKSIGFAMQTRFNVLNNVALFDKPAETWEYESIANLYQEVFDMFDIPERQEVLSTKLDFISENTRMLFEVLSSRKSHYLEWIVIFLIGIEIVAFGAYEILKSLIHK